MGRGWVMVAAKVRLMGLGWMRMTCTPRGKAKLLGPEIEDVSAGFIAGQVQGLG